MSPKLIAMDAVRTMKLKPASGSKNNAPIL